jgi:ubiquinone biosynthesis protein
MFRSIRTLRSIPRIKDIALVLAKHGFHQVAGYLQTPVTSRIRRVFSASPPPQVVEQPERLRLVLQDLGPTFIKFGQLLSTRPDLLPLSYIRELEKLQDDVSPEPFAEIRRQVEGELGGPIDQFFADFVEEPLATASIAQVHRAFTREGRPVVVKVRKQGLEKVVEQDLLVLGLLAEVMSEWPVFRFLDLQGVVRAFERAIRRELNFDYERFSVERIRENFRESQQIYIPMVYRELSKEGVLTLEFLEGARLSSLKREDLSGGRGEELASSITMALLKQIFEDGLYHADPHPGNFILMPGSRVGLIDFGNVGKFTPDMMDDLVYLLYHLVERDYRSIARLVLKIGRPGKEVDARSLALDLLDSLDQYYGHSVAEIHLGGLFQSLFSIAVRFGIVMPPQYVLLGRTLMTLEGVVRTLAPEIELLSHVQPYLQRVMRSRWGPERILKDVRSEAAEILQAVRSYPINLAEILQRVAEGRLRVESQLQNTERIERRLQEVATRIPLAILICGLLISSSLLLFSVSGGSLRQVVAILGYVAALAIFLKMLLRI